MKRCVLQIAEELRSFDAANRDGILHYLLEKGCSVETAASVAGWARNAKPGDGRFEQHPSLTVVIVG